MGEGWYPTADAVARAWLLAARRRGEGDLLALLAGGTLACGDVGLWLESRWVLFQALRAAYPAMLWETAARICGFPETLDLGDWGAIRSSSWWSWSDVQPVFRQLLDDAA